MTEESRLDSYFEALREDLPSSSDEARVRRRLAGAGVVVTLAATGNTAAAGSTITSAAAGSTITSAAAGSTVLGSVAAGSTVAAKLGLVSALSIRFASLPLLVQLGVVTAGTAAVATGPVAVAMHEHRSNVVTTQLIHDVRASATKDRANPPRVAATSLAAPPPVAAPSVTEPRPQHPSSPEVNPTDQGNNRAPTKSIISLESMASSGDPRVTATESTPLVSAQEPIASSTEREMASVDSTDFPQNPTAKAIGAREATIAPALRTETVDARNLSEETRLIDHALAAIRAGDLSLAARLLDEHAARFPHARLGRERQRVREKLKEARNRTEVP